MTDHEKENVVFRLKMAKAEESRHSFCRGYEKGRDWSLAEATPGELDVASRIAGSSRQYDAHDFHQAVAPFKDGVAIANFQDKWTPHDWGNEDFMRGFAAGAAAVWDHVKELI